MVSAKARKSPMAHSVGLYRSNQLDPFIETFAVRHTGSRFACANAPSSSCGHVDAYQVIVLMERFDEGLLLLKRLLGWDTVDLTYVKINDSHQGLLRRSWDGLTVTPSPKVSELSVATRAKITELVSGLDAPL